MIFEILPEDIERLTDVQLRRLIALLCEQEVVKAGQSASGVTYGGHQNAADGGTDVRIDVAGAISGYVPRPQTVFQSKAEDMREGKIDDEMRPGGVLRESIRKLAEKNGSYIIVSSQGSVADRALTRRRNAMAANVADIPEPASLFVDFYDRQRMATWVNQHPGIVPWVREQVGKAIPGWRGFDDWSSAPEPLDNPYFVDGDVRVVDLRKKDDGLDTVAGINRLRRILAKPGGVVRLVGLSGVGKTRLVQALFDDRIGQESLSPGQAVYADRGDEAIEPSPQELLVRLQGLNQRCILIIDNCGTELHQKLSAKISSGGGQVSLVTVEYDITDDEPENTSAFRLEPASPQIIKRIVKRRHSGLTEPEITTIAALSEGNARVALALANTAGDGESLANLNDTQLFERLFKQKKDASPALLRAARALSLVYSFDGETLEGDGAELPLLASLAGQTVDEVFEHVAELHRRQLIQKRGKWRAVLPHALAHRLAKTALQNISPSKIDKAFTDQGTPERLQRSFTRRIGYLHDSQQAQQLVSAWLTSGGWLSDLESFDESGMQDFYNAAPVDPDRALDAIEQAGRRNNSFFSEANDNRDDFVRLLRALAYEPEKFERAVKLIGDCVRPADPDNNKGLAINIFTSLFHLYLSGTHAAPAQRVAVARRLLESEDAHERALGALALNGMLENHFTSSFSFDFGARKRDYGYFPKTRNEERAWYSGVVKMCSEVAKKSLQHRIQMKEVLADKMSELVQMLGASDEIVGLVTDFANDGWPEGWAGVRKAHRKHNAARVEDSEMREKIEATTKRLEELVALLQPKTLQEKIAAYVMPESYSIRDLGNVDDDVDVVPAFHKSQEQIKAVCRDIGVALAADRAALTQVLPQLMSAKSHFTFELGAALGEKTADPRSLWDDLVEQAKLGASNGSLYLFSCVIYGIGSKDRKLADELLDEALQVEYLHPQIVHMNCTLSLNEHSVNRLLEAVKLPTVPTYSFTALAYGRSSDRLSGAQLRKLLVAIADREDGLEVALDILHMRIHTVKKDKKRDLSKEEKRTGVYLLSQIRFGRRERRGRTREDSHVGMVAKACLVAPDDEALARDLCERLLAAVGSWQTSPMDHSELVSALAARFPDIVLDVLVEKGQTKGESRRSMFSGFRDSSSDPLAMISDDVLVAWAHQKPEVRFQHLAEAVHPWTPRPNEDPTGWTSAALRLIREAPDKQQVLNTLYDRLRPSSYSSLSESLRQRLPLLESLLGEENPEITQWAEHAVTKFKAYIERVRKDEANEERVRDERFE